jgi:hypothetical protein
MLLDASSWTMAIDASGIFETPARLLNTPNYLSEFDSSFDAHNRKIRGKAEQSEMKKPLTIIRLRGLNNGYRLGFNSYYFYFHLGWCWVSVRNVLIQITSGHLSSTPLHCSFGHSV